MNIRCYKGDDHKISFKFLNLNREIDDVLFTVKDINGSNKINKKLGDGINFVNENYHIILTPEDTNRISSQRKMIYDIKIVLSGLTYTVKRGYFKIL